MDKWKLSESLIKFINELFKESGPDRLDTAYYPSIIWSLGGEIRRGEKIIEMWPPRYTLGWIARRDLKNFIPIASDEFGFVAFQPSEVDQTASGKTIDIKDHEIFVR